jgi:hypothetical protein
MVSQVVDGGSKMLQSFPGELDLSLQERVEGCWSPFAFLKHLGKLFVYRSRRDAM